MNDFYVCYGWKIWSIFRVDILTWAEIISAQVEIGKTRNCVETRNYHTISPDPNVVSNKIIVSNKLLGCYG